MSQINQVKMIDKDYRITKDILNKMKSIVDETCDQLTECNNSVYKFKESISISLSELKKKHSEFKTLINKVDSFESQEEQAIGHLKIKSDTSNSYIQNKELNLKELKNVENELIQNLQVKEKQVERMKQEISHIMEKEKTLEPLKSRAKLLKAITCTSFEYQGPNICGLIISKDKVIPFEYVPSEETNIPDKLWNKIKHIFNEQYTLLNNK